MWPGLAVWTPKLLPALLLIHGNVNLDNIEFLPDRRTEAQLVGRLRSGDKNVAGPDLRASQASPTSGSWNSAEPAAALTLSTVVARRKASFPAEYLREMAGIGVAHFNGNGCNTFLCFAEQSSRGFHPQIDVIARR